jgi:hypothetical protein
MFRRTGPSQRHENWSKKMNEQIYLTGEVNELRLHDFLLEAENDRLIAEAKVNRVYLNWFQRFLRFIGL